MFFFNHYILFFVLKLWNFVEYIYIFLTVTIFRNLIHGDWFIENPNPPFFKFCRNHIMMQYQEHCMMTACLNININIYSLDEGFYRNFFWKILVSECKICIIFLRVQNLYFETLPTFVCEILTCWGRFLNLLSFRLISPWNPAWFV